MMADLLVKANSTEDEGKKEEGLLLFSPRLIIVGLVKIKIKKLIAVIRKVYIIMKYHTIYVHGYYYFIFKNYI